MLRLAITVSALITVAGLIACGGPDGTPTDLDGSDLDETTLGLLERIPKDEVANRCYGLGGDIYSYDFTYDYIEDRYLDRKRNPRTWVGRERPPRERPPICVSRPRSLSENSFLGTKNATQ